MYKIALVGNPNCGKTTIFNLLTGANQKVGNWPGVTVEKKFGFLDLDGNSAELVDLPGIYSLEQEYRGVDENIAFDYLSEGNIDLIVNVIDATNLERGLVLTQQLLEKQIPVLLALNMMDVAEQQGISISPENLSNKLNAKLVTLTASKSEGINKLLSEIQEIYLEPKLQTKETILVNDGEPSEDKILRRYHFSRKLIDGVVEVGPCLLYTSPSPRDRQKSRMPSSA